MLGNSWSMILLVMKKRTKTCGRLRLNGKSIGGEMEVRERRASEEVIWVNKVVWKGDQGEA